MAESSEAFTVTGRFSRVTSATRTSYPYQRLSAAMPSLSVRFERASEPFRHAVTSSISSGAPWRRRHDTRIAGVDGLGDLSLGCDHIHHLHPAEHGRGRGDGESNGDGDAAIGAHVGDVTGGLVPGGRGDGRERARCMCFTMQRVLDVQPRLVGVDRSAAGVVCFRVAREAMRRGASAEGAGSGVMHVLREKGGQLVGALELRACVPRADKGTFHHFRGKGKGIRAELGAGFFTERRMLGEEESLEGVFVAQRNVRLYGRRHGRIQPWCGSTELRVRTLLSDSLTIYGNFCVPSRMDERAQQF